MHDALSREVEGLVTVSLRDRDTDPERDVSDMLDDRGYTSPVDTFVPLKWKRRHIECYFIHPGTIAEICGVTEIDARQTLAEDFGIAIGDKFHLHEVPQATLDAKEPLNNACFWL